VVALATGFELSGNMKVFIAAIPTSLIIRTRTIAFANGVHGVAPAVRKAVSDENIGRKAGPQ
jgi:hypothetical protein